MKSPNAMPQFDPQLPQNIAEYDAAKNVHLPQGYSGQQHIPQPKSAPAPWLEYGRQPGESVNHPHPEPQYAPHPQTPHPQYQGYLGAPNPNVPTIPTSVNPQGQHTTPHPQQPPPYGHNPYDPHQAMNQALTGLAHPGYSQPPPGYPPNPYGAPPPGYPPNPYGAPPMGYPPNPYGAPPPQAN